MMTVVLGGVGVMTMMGCSNDSASRAQDKDIFAPQATEQTTEQPVEQTDPAQQQIAPTPASTPANQNTSAGAQAPQAQNVPEGLASPTVPSASQTAQTPSAPAPVSDEEMERISKEAKECVDGGGLYNSFAQKCFKE